MKRIFCLLLALPVFWLTGCRAETAEQEQPPHQFTYIGVYTWDPTPDFYDFFKACGINTLQLSERLWYFNAQDEGFEERYRGYADQITQAQAAGFYVDLLFFSNIEQSMGPDEYNVASGGIGDWFDPRDAAALEQKMEYNRKLISACSHADFFTLVAGDPGGFIGQLGEGNTEAFAVLCKEFAKASQQLAPDVKLHINTWALSAYGEEYAVASDYLWWKQETEMTRQLLAVQGLFGADVGICFPTHDYYRALSRNLWNWAVRTGKEEDFPVPYPQPADVQTLRAGGVGDVWLWPFGLLDSDGDAAYGATFASNLRYVKQYLEQVRGLEADGIMVDWTWKSCYGMAVNYYGFGRMVNDPSVTVEQTLREYAAFLATPETAQTLSEILIYIENMSEHESHQPVRMRLDPLPCSIGSAQQALDALQAVQPLQQSDFPLPESVAQVFTRIEARLDRLLLQGE